MSTKPETNLITRIHKQLPTIVSYDKMANPFSAGVWDVYYDSPGGDGWVEYKFWNRLFTPVEFFDALGKLLSPRQKHWGMQRYRNGRRVAVIVGFKDKQIAIASPDNVMSAIPHDSKSTAEWITKWLNN